MIGSNPPPPGMRKPQPPPNPPFRNNPDEKHMKSDVPEIDKLCKAINRIADAIQENARATELLAHATAMQYSDEEEETEHQSLSDH